MRYGRSLLLKEGHAGIASRPRALNSTPTSPGYDGSATAGDSASACLYRSRKGKGPRDTPVPRRFATQSRANAFRGTDTRQRWLNPAAERGLAPSLGMLTSSTSRCLRIVEPPVQPISADIADQTKDPCSKSTYIDAGYSGYRKRQGSQTSKLYTTRGITYKGRARQVSRSPCARVRRPYPRKHATHLPNAWPITRSFFIPELHEGSQ